MKQNLKNIIITTGGIIGVVSSVFLLTFIVFAWTGPLNTPPTCPAGEVGCDEPLHSGVLAQSKTGGLLLNTGGAEYGLIIQNGNVGIGTASPTAKLEVAGQVKITGGSPGAGKVLTSDAEGLGQWSVPTGIRIKSFTTVETTSWTVPTGVDKVWVVAAAGGGGGGTGESNIGGGGGGGGEAVFLKEVSVTPGSNIAVVVGEGGAKSSGSDGSAGGHGGTTSFGSLSLTGGRRGSGNTPGAKGGSGGADGGYGLPLYAYGYTGGNGGGTIIGSGGSISRYTLSSVGRDGGLYGGGGGGGSVSGVSGAGAQGAVFIIY